MFLFWLFLEMANVIKRCCIGELKNNGVTLVSIVNMSDLESSSSELCYESGDTSSKQAMN